MDSASARTAGNARAAAAGARACWPTAVCSRRRASTSPTSTASCAPTWRARCVGGTFFDYLGAGGEATARRTRDASAGAAEVEVDPVEGDPDRLFAFVQALGGAITAAYLPIVARRRDEPWGERERRWQLVR